jgi:hypothetical protein
MARRVVQALLENEENLAADVGVDVGILFPAGCLKPDLHAVVAEPPCPHVLFHFAPVK